MSSWRSRPRQYVHTPGLPPRQLEERAQVSLAALWLMKQSREAALFSLFCFGLLHLVLRIWADGLSLGVGEVSPATAHSRWKPVGVVFVCLSRCNLGWGLTSAWYHMSGGSHPTWVSPYFLWPGAGFGIEWYWGGGLRLENHRAVPSQSFTWELSLRCSFRMAVVRLCSYLLYFLLQFCFHYFVKGSWACIFFQWQ